jgi:hypothetical protein
MTGIAGPPKKKARRPTPAPIVGVQHRVHRMKNSNDEWVDWDGKSTGKSIESLTHRFHRKKGWKMTTNCHEEEEIKQSKLLQEALEGASKSERKKLSAIDRSTNMSYFECFVLEKAPETHFAAQLRKIKDPTKVKDSLTFQKPSPTLVLAYLNYLRNTRKQKYNSIDHFLVCLSMTCVDVGSSLFEKNISIKKCMEEWLEIDEEERAEAFRPEELLPELYKALFDNDNAWTDDKKIHIWARFLVQFACIGRSSDVCWAKKNEYCPVIDDIEYPPNPDQWTDDPDRLPTFIIVAWRKWKGRPKKLGNSKYRLRIMANFLDFRFCPVHWLMKSLSIRKELKKSDPILPPMTSTTYQRNLKILFSCNEYDADGDGKYTCYSSHSLRRSAAQWAGRCGLGELDIRDIGRWCSLDHVGRYVAEGQRLRAEMEFNHGIDPIVNFWVMSADTKFDSVQMSSRLLNGP